MLSAKLLNPRETIF